RARCRRRDARGGGGRGLNGGSKSATTSCDEAVCRADGRGGRRGQRGRARATRERGLVDADAPGAARDSLRREERARGADRAGREGGAKVGDVGRGGRRG